MDAKHFDAFFKSLASGAFRLRSRRGVLAGLTTGLLAALPLALGDDAEAKNKKKKGKKKKKKKTEQPLPSPLPPPALNAYGCVGVGQACRGDSALCCSGICRGAPPQAGQADTSVCVAHDAGICFADSDLCTLGSGVKCAPNNPGCFCTLTTGNAGFCADWASIDTELSEICRLCSVDTDCEAEFGPGAACVVLGGVCTPYCTATGRTACLPPAPDTNHGH